MERESPVGLNSGSHVSCTFSPQLHCKNASTGRSVLGVNTPDFYIQKRREYFSYMSFPAQTGKAL